MNILRLAGEIFLIYLLYRLIFDFIIPIYQTTKKVKKQFGEMQAGMDEQLNKYKNQTKQTTTSASTAPIAKKEDYIDYEEVKTN